MSSNQCKLVCASAENSCSTKIQLHEANCVWTIENFDFHEAEGSKIKSPKFTAVTNQNVKWYLEVKPNSKIADEENVSFFVKLSSHSTLDDSHEKLFAKFRAAVLDCNHQEVSCMPVIANAEVNEYSFEKGWGREKFIEKCSKFRNTILVNNKLTFICTIIFSYVRNALTNTIHVHHCDSSPLYDSLPECDLAENYEILLENHDFSDVVLCVQGKEYPAHKNILAARSSVFAAMFKHNFKENDTNRIEIEDMNEEVVTEMLRFIYTGKCGNYEKLADGLLVAADKYDLNRLKMICAEALYKTISVDNAADILTLADLHCVEELKSKAIKFMVARFSEVVNSTGWKNVLMSNPLLILEVCQTLGGRLAPPNDGK